MAAIRRAPATDPLDRRFVASQAYLDTARKVIPRGVNSARRGALRPTPLVFAGAAGSRITDVDGNEYVDYVAGYGPMLLGHQPAEVVEAVRSALDAGVLYGGQHAAEAELAERIVRLVPSAEQVLLNVTGSEADQVAVRLARAATGRPKVVKFEGHYHGWLDPLIANGAGSPAGSGPVPRPVIAPPHAVIGSDVLVCPWNDTAALGELLDRHGHEIAAVIMEAVAINGGNLFPADGYLAEARRLCDQHGCVLIFDEVVTGFRLAPGGAQERLGVTPDLTVLAKALGSGLPISAVAGRAAIMSVAENVVAHAGTYNGNVLAVAAANATLDVLETERDTLYPALEHRSARLATGVDDIADSFGVPLRTARAGSVIRLHWGAPDPVRSYADVLAGQTQPLHDLSEALVRHGIHARENGLWYVSAAHTDDDVDHTLAMVSRSLAQLTGGR